RDRELDPCQRLVRRAQQAQRCELDRQAPARPRPRGVTLRLALRRRLDQRRADFRELSAFRRCRQPARFRRSPEAVAGVPDDVRPRPRLRRGRRGGARRARRMTAARALPTLVVAAALALGSAVSLGLARFAYALLLPAMRLDLGWSYFTAGAMNTANAAGYLVGALAAPPCLRRYGARAVLVVATAATALALAAHGAVAGDAALYALRFVSGALSAPSLVAGAV